MRYTKIIVSFFMFLLLFNFNVVFSNSISESKLQIEPRKSVIVKFISEYLLKDIPDSYQYIKVNFNDIKLNNNNYKHIQKIIYTGYVDNKKGKFYPNSKVNAYDFYYIVGKILNYNFINENNKSKLQARNVKIYDIVLVKKIFDEGSALLDNGNFSKVFKSEDEKELLKIMFDVYNTLITEHYGSENINKKDILYEGIEGITKGIKDDYTEFFRPSEANDFNNKLNLNFDGIGIVYGINENNEIIIVYVLEGGPAEKAGIKKGDIILKIDGNDVSKNNIEELKEILTKKKFDTVKLEIKRGEKILNFSIVYGKINIENITENILDKSFFYVRINNMTENVFNEFKKSIDKFKSKKLEKLVIDLRGNGGGYLDETLKILNLFIPKGKNIIYLKNRDGEETSLSEGNNILDINNYKVFILIDGNTASASELLVLTLKEYFPNIKIIGEKSYGKGSVQNIKSYPNGSIIKYTTALWLSGKHNSINHIGITPDYVIPFNKYKYDEEGIDNQLEYILKNY